MATETVIVSAETNVRFPATVTFVLLIGEIEVDRLRKFSVRENVAKIESSLPSLRTVTFRSSGRSTGTDRGAILFEDVV